MTKNISVYELRRFQEMIVAHVLQHGNDHRYNVPLLIEFNQEWALDSVEEVLKRFILQLPELGFRLTKYEQRFVLTPSLEPVSIETVDVEGDELNLSYCIKSAHQYRFDLEKDALSRFTIIRHADQLFVVCVFHHLIVDGLTIDNMKRLVVDIARADSSSEVVSSYISSGQEVPRYSTTKPYTGPVSIDPGLIYFSESNLLPLVRAVGGTYKATLAEILLCITGYALKGTLGLDKIAIPHGCRNTLDELNATGCFAGLIELEIAHSGNIEADIGHCRGLLEQSESSHAIDTPGLFSFRVIESGYAEQYGISFLHENELFKRHKLIAPNKTGVSVLFELTGAPDNQAVRFAIEYDSAKYSEQVIHEIGSRIESHLTGMGEGNRGYAQLSARPPAVSAADRSDRGLTVRQFLADGRVKLYSKETIRERIQHYKRVFTANHVHTLVITAPKSIDVLSAIFACYELEITYIPLDPNHPREVRDVIVDQCGANAVMELSADTLAIEYTTAAKRLSGALYVIYTSGSTGAPKGVKIGKKEVEALCNGMFDTLGLSAPISSLSYAELYFDMSVPDIYLPYLYGGEIVLIDRQIRAMPDHLLRVINAVTPTLLQCTPTALGMLSKFHLRTLKVDNLVLGGERVPPHLTPLQLPDVKQLWNFYGPTEATVWCAFRKIDLTNDVDIDTSLPGYHVGIYRNGEVCQPYELGEVCVQGPISSGYIESRLNEAAFIEVVREGHTRTCYSTGDLGEYIPGKGIRLHGRMDSQIKHNGVRIELEEIEATFLTISGVRGCVAVYDESIKRLYALVMTHHSEHTRASLLKKVEGLLPESKLPQEIVLVDRLPVNANGKKERRISRLRGLLTKRTSERTPHDHGYTEDSDTRDEIVSIITEGLKIDNRTALDKTFHDHGGNSIKAIQIVQNLKKSGIKVDVTNLIDSRSMSDFVDRVMERLQ